MDSVKILSSRIVDEIILDFTDRRGLRQEWEQIDDDIQKEIKFTWTKIVVNILENKSP